MTIPTWIHIVIILRIGALGGIISLGALLSSKHLVFDLISHFRIQYIVLIAVLLGIALYRQRISIAVVLSICLGVHASDVFQSLKPREKLIENQAAALSIMSSNLLASNDNYDTHATFIKTVSPDIIVFQEYTTDWDAALSESLHEHPYRLTVATDSPFGIAMYSKLPLVDEKVVTISGKSRPSVEAIVSIGRRTLKILGTHPPPPITEALYTERNHHLKEIAERVRAQTNSMVVVGDLNTSPWSKHFSNFLEAGQLFDGRRGHGVFPTWPTWFFPLQIPIDHIVGTDSVKVTSMNTSSGLGSDHRTLWVNLQF